MLLELISHIPPATAGYNEADGSLLIPFILMFSEDLTRLCHPSTLPQNRFLIQIFHIIAWKTKKKKKAFWFADSCGENARRRNGRYYNQGAIEREELFDASHMEGVKCNRTFKKRP